MSKKLRCGYSTGACAAAVSKAAWIQLKSGEAVENVWVRFPDGQDRLMELLEKDKQVCTQWQITQEKNFDLQMKSMASIRKDGGDDPDCTSGAIIYARMSAAFIDSIQSEDYLLKIGKGQVILRGVEGIGICTRSGLDCDRGHWAMNKIPRQMICENLQLAGFVAGYWLLEIGIVDGERIAKNTLNAQLGVIGGLSLLGTSGIVQPYSNDAWIQTIRVLIRSHALSGGSSLVLCTGGRTRASALTYLQEIPSSAFVNIGDFIVESLNLAREFHIQKIMIACMPGKLCKYASGYKNTHAHKKPQNMDLLINEIRYLLPNEESLYHRLEICASVREALLLIPEKYRIDILHRLAQLAFAHFDHEGIHLLVFDFNGNLLFEEHGIAGRIDVISCGIDANLDESSCSLLQQADIIYGSSQLAKAFPSHNIQIIHANAREMAIEALTLSRSGKHVAVLASGDSLYHGIGSTLASLRTNEQIIYHPNITAFQALFSKLGIPWHNARLFSVHAGEDIPVRTLAESPLAIIYGGRQYPANVIAQEILNCFPNTKFRKAIVAQNLGLTNEQIFVDSLKQCAKCICNQNSILLLLQDQVTLPLALGLDNYDHERNLITSPEVRAIILSKLRLPAWGVLWDIGAGSGSVGLEASALREHLQVHAIERNSARCAMIVHNRQALGISHYTLHEGEAAQLLPSLPTPDRIFFGGGAVPNLLNSALSSLQKSGLIVVTAVTLETLNFLFSWHPELRIDFCKIDIAHEAPLAEHYHHLKSQHTIYLFTFGKENNFSQFPLSKGRGLKEP